MYFYFVFALLRAVPEKSSLVPTNLTVSLAIYSPLCTDLNLVSAWRQRKSRSPFGAHVLCLTWMSRISPGRAGRSLWRDLGKFSKDASCECPYSDTLSGRALAEASDLQWLARPSPASQSSARLAYPVSPRSQSAGPSTSAKDPHSSDSTSL